MEIRRWFFCAVNCVIVCSITGKTFSLNKIIEAESQHKIVAHTTISPKIEDWQSTAERFTLDKEPLSRISKKFQGTDFKLTAKRFSLDKRPLNRISKKFQGTGLSLNLTPLGKRISPLKYRKTFQISSPLKPKRVKHTLSTRQKRKNQSVKREVDGNAILNQKYIPLLRNLGMLFDNILGTNSGESHEVRRNKKNRLRYYDISEESDDVSCQCLGPTESKADSESKEETATISEALSALSTETPATEATTATADNTPAGNFRSFRQHKNLPLLLPRNTSGSRRNDHGIGEGSRAAHNGSAERYIAGDHGDSEHYTERGQDKSHAESDEEYTDRPTRNGASGVRARSGVRELRTGALGTETYEDDAITQEEAEVDMDIPRRNIVELHGQDKLETGRVEAESRELLPKPLRRQEGEKQFLSADEVTDTAESVQSEEDNEEGDVSVAHDSSNDKRFPYRNGEFTTKDQKADARYETLMNSLNLNITQNDAVKSSDIATRKGPVVLIIDGYSVTRHKNGENKLAEKAIRIRP